MQPSFEVEISSASFKRPIIVRIAPSPTPSFPASLLRPMGFSAKSSRARNMWNMENVVDGPGAFPRARLSINFLSAEDIMLPRFYLNRLVIIICAGYTLLERKDCCVSGISCLWLLKVYLDPSLGASWSMAALSLFHSSRFLTLNLFFLFHTSFLFSQR
jgi:hypothetical protein